MDLFSSNCPHPLVTHFIDEYSRGIEQDETPFELGIRNSNNLSYKL